MTATFHDLRGKTVFITGGGSGIGAALTDGFLAQGAKVGFVQRSDASAFCDEMEGKHGTRPLFVACDITDMHALKAAIAHTGTELGPLDVLVNNAANDKRHDALEVDEGFWDWSQAINLKAYFFACQAAAAAMRGRGGVIVNFSSISYMMGQAGYASYTTANGGITAMTHSLAREFGPEKIRVNALAPGWVMTQKQREMWVTEEALEAHLAKQCLKETLAPEDVVGATLFLASDTSRMMTGQLMVVDGGVVSAR
ncbi:SDR family oxidoreductase [Sulfitobacter albidus]|uniref:SDR family oxidoreductase n=1 Tax=Sulfitobacter albidus TaxID=2829501 RepID=A0A975JGP0_9RHOB|nr:SDR family oxidoreductase [Sulfitobacter albidus]QUJ78202.1 SDR family oxidoreductase [Sulfitobacter albidus]